MITFTPLPNQLYTHSGYDRFVDHYLSAPNINTETIGESDDGGYDIYGLRYGGTSKKPTILLVGSIHGTEWQSAYYVARFMKIIANIEDMYYPEKELIYRLRDNFSFYAIPCANPWGFDRERRVNSNRRDLNRDFEDFSQSETRVIRDVVDELKPVSLIDAHAWGREHEALTANRELEDNKYWIDNIISNLSYYFDTKVTNYGASDDKGVQSVWISNQYSSQGRPSIGILIETPNAGSGYRWKPLISNQFGIDTCLMLCLYLQKRLIAGVQNPTEVS